MKNFRALFTITFIIGFFSISYSATPQGMAPILTTYQANTFIFKADKSLIGATVEIVSEEGEVISVQKLTKSKFIIDFSKFKSGSYIVRIEKNDTMRHFQFEKR